MIVHESVCRGCNGSGFTHNHECYYCHGSGVYKIEIEHADSMCVVTDKDGRLLQAPSGKLAWAKPAHAKAAFCCGHYVLTSALFDSGELVIRELAHDGKLLINGAEV